MRNKTGSCSAWPTQAAKRARESKREQEREQERERERGRGRIFKRNAHCAQASRARARHRFPPRSPCSPGGGASSGPSAKSTEAAYVTCARGATGHATGTRSNVTRPGPRRPHRAGFLRSIWASRAALRGPSPEAGGSGPEASRAGFLRSISYISAAKSYELHMFSTPRGWTPGGRAGGRAGPRRSGRGARGAGAPAHRSTPPRHHRPRGAAPLRPQRARRPPPAPKLARQPRARTRCAPAPPRLRSHGLASGLKRG